MVKYMQMSTTVVKYSEIVEAGADGLIAPDGPIAIDFGNDGFTQRLGVVLTSTPIQLDLVKAGLVFTPRPQNCIIGNGVFDPSVDDTVLSFRRGGCCFKSTELHKMCAVSVGIALENTFKGCTLMLQSLLLKPQPHLPHDEFREMAYTLVLRDLRKSLLEHTPAVTEEQTQSVEFRFIAAPVADDETGWGVMCDCKHPPENNTKLYDIASLRCTDCPDPTFEEESATETIVAEDAPEHIIL